MSNRVKITLIIFACFATLASSQAYAEPNHLNRLGAGPIVGVGAITFGGDDADRPRVESTNKLGVALGGFANVTVHEQLFLQLKLLFATKGTGIEIDNEPSGGCNLSYLEMPILASYKLPIKGKVAPYISTGVGMGVLLTSEKEDRDGIKIDIKDDTTFFDVGLIAGVGAAIDLSLKGTIVMEAQYEWGMRQAHKNSQLDVKNRAFTFMVGYEFRPWMLN